MTALNSPSHILITGASNGIGAALAKRFASAGVRLSLTARNRERLDDVAKVCRARGAETNAGLCDVRDAEALRVFIETVDEQGPIAMVIANAGVGGEFVIAGSAGESAEVAREIFETNVMGVANTLAPLLPRFLARREGHVVIMSSLAAFIGLPDAPVYSASKAAVRIYGQALQRLLSPNKVRVTVVCPGFVDTAMSASLSGSRPLLWSADRAANKIATGLARGAREICFPWPLSTLSRIGPMLPQMLVDRAVARRRSHHDG